MSLRPRFFCYICLLLNHGLTSPPPCSFQSFSASASPSRAPFKPRPLEAVKTFGEMQTAAVAATTLKDGFAKFLAQMAAVPYRILAVLSGPTRRRRCAAAAILLRGTSQQSARSLNEMRSATVRQSDACITSANTCFRPGFRVDATWLWVVAPVMP